MNECWIAELAGLFTARRRLSEPTTRRGLLVRLGLLAGGGVAAMGLGPDRLVAKKKKKKKKKKDNEPLDAYDWLDTWNTTLNNGVKGSATFENYDPSWNYMDGFYSNSVGSGTFDCIVSGRRGTSLHCTYVQPRPGEELDETGGFSIALTGENRWFGSYWIDGGGTGTWGGVRR